MKDCTQLAVRGVLRDKLIEWLALCWGTLHVYVRFSPNKESNLPSRIIRIIKPELRQHVKSAGLPATGMEGRF